MKLDVAADRNQNRNETMRRGSRMVRLALGAASIIAIASGLAGAAAALDGIDLSAPMEAPAEGECPQLIQIKYPFLSCAGGVIGLSDGDATWENSRQLPIQSDFNEGNGYWGDDLNQDQ